MVAENRGNMSKSYAGNRRQKLLDQLQLRRSYLDKQRRTLARCIARAPEGNLRITKVRGRDSYYLRTDSADLNGKYIPKKNTELIRKLAQKDYNIKAMNAIDQEQKAIDAFLNAQTSLPEELYYELSPARRKLVTPIEQTDEEFIREWLSEVYDTSSAYEINTDLVTKRGERVRSKSELIIANTLYEMGVPYKYERPLYLKGMGTVHPDFTVLNVRLRKVFFWEHQGMLDREEYAERTAQKMCAYVANGLLPGRDLILSYETKDWQLSTSVIEMIIKEFCL